MPEELELQTVRSWSVGSGNRAPGLCLQQAPLVTEHLSGHLTLASVLGFCFVLWQMLQWEKNQRLRYDSKNHLLVGSPLGREFWSPRSFCPALQFRPFTAWLCACLPGPFQLCNRCTVTVFRAISGMALGTGAQLPGLGLRRTLLSTKLRVYGF